MAALSSALVYAAATLVQALRASHTARSTPILEDKAAAVAALTTTVVGAAPALAQAVSASPPPYRRTPAETCKD